MIKKRLRIIMYLIFFSFVFFYSCASNTSYFDQADLYVSQSDYHRASKAIEEREEKLYTKKDLVLKSLDKGLLFHYEGNYKKSNEELSKAEQYMFEYFSKSISQSLQSFIINDTLIDYAGDPYEDIYANLFMALNYIALGEIDEAMVEIRRFDTKQKNLLSNYEAAQSKANQDSELYFGEMSFHNSALARYLSMLLYRADNNQDSARIDLDYLKAAFRDQSQLYPFALPSSLEEELLELPDLARVNIISFTGLAPIKIEEVIRFYTDDMYYKLALPIMVKRDSRISSIRVEAENNDTKEFFTLYLEPLEDIATIAFDTFKQKQDLLYFKAMARAMVKSLTTGVLDAASRIEQDPGASSLLQVLTFASIVSNELSEVADLRASRYFPSKASVGGIHLPPGIYTIKISFIDSWGSFVKEEKILDFEVKKNNINLVEAICLQ